MDTSFRASSRRSYGLPKPDADLVDWTSKIKAIQRQVDADEDSEQKRLDEEIEAAKQARLRRRSRTPNRPDSADLRRCSTIFPGLCRSSLSILQQVASSLGCSVTPLIPPIKMSQSP